MTIQELADLWRPEEDECECGGDGWIVGDCIEDSCCCADPELEHGLYPCPLCNPKGER